MICKKLFSKPSNRRNLAIVILTCTMVPLANAASEIGQCIVAPSNLPFESSSLPPEIEPLVDTMIFTENFDDQPDWYIEENGRCLSGTEAICASIPNNWDFYYSGERWHPDGLNDSSFQPSAQVTALQFRGSSGKSYITYDESYGGPSQWGSDGTLGKDLGQDYTDIYVEFWFKYQPGYRWASTEANFGIDATKKARFTSYTGGVGGSRFKFLQGGSNTPLAITQLKISTGNTGLEQTLTTTTTRCSPVETNYTCTFQTPRPSTPYLGYIQDKYADFVETIGDGEWHKWGFRAKYNSAPGVSDGIIQTWVDNVLVSQYLDIPFMGVDPGTPPSGFNTFMIGGNMNNRPAPDSERYEQWLAFDDIRVFSLK